MVPYSVVMSRSVLKILKEIDFYPSITLLKTYEFPRFKWLVFRNE